MMYLWSNRASLFFPLPVGYVAVPHQQHVMVDGCISPIPCREVNGQALQARRRIHVDLFFLQQPRNERTKLNDLMWSTWMSSLMHNATDAERTGRP